MPPVTVNWRAETGLHTGHEVLKITATADGDTYASRIGKPQCAIFQPNRDNAANDSWGVTISGQEITIQLINTTSVTGTLEIWGTP